MNTSVRYLFVCSISLLLATGMSHAKSVDQFLEQFDKNKDGQLDKEEFAEALKTLGIRVKTPAGEKRAAHARQLLNAKAATVRASITDGKVEFSPSQPRYQQRHRQADYLIQKYDLGHYLTTHEEVLIERAFSDLSLAEAKPDAAVAATPAATPQAGPVISFLENNFRIRESGELVNGEVTSDQPAKLSWTRARGQSSYYAIDAAVLYTPDYLDHKWEDVENGKISVGNEWVFGARLRPEFEAHVSTQDDASTNQLKYSALLQGRYKYFPGGDDNKRTESLAPDQLPFLSASYFEISPSYVTDKIAKVRTWGWDGKYQPAFPWLNLNHDGDRPLFRLRWLEGSMQGGIGLIFREYDAGAAVNGMNESYGEFTGFYKANLKLFGRLTLTAGYEGAAIAWGDRKDHEFFDATAQLTLDPKNHFTVGLTYSCGEKEPTFEKVDSVTAWVGAKF